MRKQIVLGSILLAAVISNVQSVEVRHLSAWESVRVERCVDSQGVALALRDFFILCNPDAASDYMTVQATKYRFAGSFLAGFLANAFTSKVNTKANLIGASALTFSAAIFEPAIKRVWDIKFPVSGANIEKTLVVGPRGGLQAFGVYTFGFAAGALAGRLVHYGVAKIKNACEKGKKTASSI